MSRTRTIVPLFLLLGACQEDAERLPPAPVPLAAPHSDDPRVDAARGALSRSDLALARPLVQAALPLCDAPERELLAARLFLLEGDLPAMEAELSAARRAAPSDPLVLATSAELHAWAGLLSTAEGEIAAALASSAPAGPALLRARGVTLISTPQCARQGLDLLLEARRSDPSLPFLDRALAQGHYLVGRLDLPTDKQSALDHARASVLLDGEDQDARLLLADALMACGEWGAALTEYEGLLSGGKAIAPELARHYKNAGLLALAQDKRELALAHFLRARELGLDREGLGSAATILSGEAQRHLQFALAALPKDREGASRELALAEDFDKGLPGLGRGRAALRSAEADSALAEGDKVRAEQLYRAALELDPTAIEARLLLGHLLAQRGAPAEAAEEWQHAIDRLYLEDIDLPEPLHIRVADAWLAADRPLEARLALSAYLLEQPIGRFAGVTRRLLMALPDEAGEVRSSGAGGG